MKMEDKYLFTAKTTFRPHLVYGMVISSRNIIDILENRRLWNRIAIPIP
jgi:hypothetical protein